MILKVEDKHEGGILPFELAQKEIQDTLWQQGVQPKIREYLTKLRSDGFIKLAEGYTDVGQAGKATKVSDNK
jgi:peptidyl-prolyl cis-trans isomerase SurA